MPDGAGQIWLDDVACTGTESRLIDCGNRGLGIHNCAHSEDAGVRCTGTKVIAVFNSLCALLYFPYFFASKD